MLLLTDPPYNIDYEGKTEKKLKIENDSMNNEEFVIFLEKAFKNAVEVMNKGASFYIWHAETTRQHFIKAMENLQLKISEVLIWNKNHFSMGRLDYHFKHEPCLYGWKEGAGHKWYGDRSQSTVLDFNKPMKNDIHPTMKPLDLISYQIQNSTKKNDKVLDLFGGSGSTLIACENLKRECYMMEYDSKYCDAIIRRWEEYTGEKAEKING